MPERLLDEARRAVRATVDAILGQVGGARQTRRDLTPRPVRRLIEERLGRRRR